MLIRLRDSYVVADDEVKLSVLVGEGQKSFVEVLLDGTTIGQGATIEELSLGRGETLGGRKLRITTTVTDTNENTNRTNVTYRLTGGPRDQTWESAYEVTAAGDTVDYDAIFRLL